MASEPGMLLRVGIDPDAGQELAEGAKGPGPLLVRYLRERCLLVTESEAAAADLLRAFRATSSVELLQALTLLVQQRLLPPPNPKPTPLQVLTSVEELTSWQAAAELVMLAEYRLDSLDQSGLVTEPELCTLRDALNSQAVATANDTWQQPVKAGEHRDAVWRERFAPLARHTRRVYIVDGYAAANLVAALTTGQRTGAKAGAEWFLGHLARSRVESLHLVCSARPIRQQGSTVEQAKQLVAGWFDGQGTGTKLDLHLADGNFAHGRRIAFEGWAGFDIHKGLATFDHPRLPEAMGLNASTGLADEVIREFRSLARSGT